MTSESRNGPYKVIMLTRRKIVVGSAFTLFGPRRARSADSNATSPIPLRWAYGLQRLKGVNVLQPFGWGISGGNPPAYVSDPFRNGGTWGQVMPAVRRALIRSTGFDVYRLAIDPGPLITAENDASMDRYINQVSVAIADLVASDLLVIADMHVNGGHPVSGWNNANLTDGVSGPKFQRLALVERRLAAAIEALGMASRVCFELFNEPPFASQITGDPWPTQLQYLFDTVRRAAPNLTLVVGGSGFNSIDDRWGLIALDPRKFDDNTIFSWHGYEPLQLTLQGTPGHFQYIHRLAFPPRKSNRSKALEDIAIAINADPGASASEKLDTIAYFTRRRNADGLDTYFDTPQDEIFIARRIRKVTDWADTQNVPRARLMNGEFGCNGDFRGIKGATLETRVAFIQVVRQLCDAAGIGTTIIHELNDTASGCGISDHRTFEFMPKIRSALGLGQ